MTKKFRRRLVQLSLMTVSPLGLLAAPSPALAQAHTRRFDIPAQSLSSAILEFSRQSDVMVVVSPELMAGRQSRALKGSMPVNEAIAQLLRGSHLRAVPNSAGGFRIERSTQAATTPTASSSAPSKSPTDQAAFRDDDIVVTARKRDERAINIPIALTAVTGEQIEKRGANSLVDFLQEAPGVGIYDNGAGRSKLTIRGISASLGGNENGYYLDDLPFTGVTVPIVPDVRAWDLDRVEVLRGPQGTLFGEGSMGGTVRILTMGADLNNWEAKGDAFGSDTYGSGKSNGGVKGAFNAPIIPGVLAVRVAGTHERYQGWIDDDTTGARDLNDQTSDTWRAKVRFDPTGRLSITGSYWYSNESFPNGGASATDEGQASQTGIRQSSIRYKLRGVSARYSLPGAQLFYGYAHNDLSFLQTGTLAGQPALIDIGIGVTSHEFRISNAGGPLQLTAGAYLRTANRADTLLIPNFFIDSNSLFQSRAYAFFGEGTYTLPSAPIELTVGLRYFEERNTSIDFDAGVAGPADKGRFHSLNPRFSIAWHPTDHTTIYASAAKGFRSGQIQGSVSLQLAQQAGVVLPSDLKEDTIWSYELGAKADLFGHLVTAEAAIFYSDWRDVAVSVPIADTGLFGLTNSEGTRTKGVEMSLSIRPMRGLTLSTSGSYIDGRYRGAVPGTQIVAGTSVDEVPKFTANASVDYRSHLRDGLTGFARLGWQHNSRRQYSASSIYSPGDVIDKVDGRVGLDFDTATVALFVDNLTNENGSTTFRTTSIVGGVTTTTGLRLRPRTVGLELNFKFRGPAR